MAVSSFHPLHCSKTAPSCNVSAASFSSLPPHRTQSFIASSARISRESRGRPVEECNLRRFRGGLVSFRSSGVIARNAGERMEHHSGDHKQIGAGKERDFTGTACVPVYVMLPVSSFTLMFLVFVYVCVCFSGLI
ncbi:hypothetical protein Tsubulata_027751 [Turnera subulata]|uniref:Transmembrane protein n=1 Tax=Turnera subulata TaxID=218843 RepID=A0A9Q0GAQ1_9ROSI|nr:hypothetical protein Tsubulata_027751 [Turnera subulata]